MGQWISSKLDYSLVSEESPTDALCGTPDSSKRILTIDPRSPTADINRTPIEVTSTPKASGTGDVDNSPVTSMMSTRPRSLHQRIMDKRRKEVDA